MNKVIHGADARATILQGANELYLAVKSTFGPTSANVGIMRPFRTPHITHDGVTVARAIDLKGDHSIGAELIKQVAVQMEEKLGDGTTTVTILAYNILKLADDRVSIGFNPMLLKRELDKDVKTVLAKLPELSEVSTDTKRIAEIATISAGDSVIGNLVAEVVDKIGKDGTITVEAGHGLEMESEIVEGFTFNQGYTAPFMVSDTARMETVLENPTIVLCDMPITLPQELIDITQKLQGKKNIVLIANEFSGAVLSILSQFREIVKIVAIKSPSFGDNRTEMLNDLAALTGAVVGTETTKFEIGAADKIIVKTDSTTVIGGAGDLKTRVKELTERIKATKDKFQIKQLNERKATLQGKVAIIRVGGNSETEIGEKKDRVNDAVFAAKAALDEGTVPGGATTLLLLSKYLPEGSLLRSAMEKPFEILLENAGLDSDDWKDKITLGFGIDTNSPDKLVDLRKKGIIDPTKTVRVALENAVSVAGTGITMKTIIVEIPEEKKHETF